MAISAKFEANFDQFVSSTKNAEASLKNLETAGGKVGTTLDSMKGGAMQLAGAFGIAFSVGAVVSFGKELLRMGDEIVRVADRTGLTTKEVQQLSYVARQSGNSIEELTGAIGQMQNRLSSGDKSAVSSVRELGLSMEALSAASPADQLEQIATAIAKIPDPAERTRIAMDLFGKSGTAILPTLTSQFAALRNEAPAMSDATVKALDRAGDQLDKFGMQLKVWAAESYNYAGQAFDAITKAAYNAIATFSELTVSVITMAAKFPGMGTVLKVLGVDLAAMTANAQWFRDAAAGMGVTVEEAAPKVAKLGQAAKDSAVDLDAAAAAAKRKADADEAVAKALAHTLAEAKSLLEFEDLAAKREFEIRNLQTQATNQAVLDLFKEKQAAEAANAAFLSGALAAAQAQDRLNATVRGTTASLNQQIDAAFALAQALAAANGMTIASVGHRPGEGPGINGAAPSSGFSLGGAFSLGPAPTFAPPVISSHASGGPVSAGLAMLHDDEYVVPKGGALVSRGGSGPNITIYVNGTAADVARKVAAEVMRTVKAGTKMGSA